MNIREEYMSALEKALYLGQCLLDEEKESDDFLGEVDIMDAHLQIALKTLKNAK